MTHPNFKAALAHVAPVFLDKDATVDKACSLIREAARNGSQLIVFPETYIPAFPVWCALQAPIHNHDLFCELAENSIQIDGPELAKITETARECEMFVSMGFNEGTNVSDGCIWNSNVLIDDTGNILCHHRKIVPTFYEKLVWAPGDGAGLEVCPTRLGRVGMLICGENTNPLARFTLLAQGEQVHLSTYPPVWPSHDPAVHENYDLKNAILIRAGAHSFEGKLFNLVAAGYLDQAARDLLAKRDPEAGRILDASPRGISVAIGPHGAPISEIMQEEEGILYADIDLSSCVEPKQLHDLAGGYNRFDIFQLTVDRTAQRPIRFKYRDDDTTEPHQPTFQS
ncbi:carbon-nitrogen hydrolase family protein [uncultured Gimesia sp.]|mgnify:FL=1|uniref:carbon-nitrogen hydrolase family protein n=1 Tax=uncultured Gimesia sp. TaxID=1678688 RepID=UPI0030D847D7|tara:strand:+ start:20197 stop:21216 length:1020 start_codon:yes stop_codon:yes gene_type:complete